MFQISDIISAVNTIFSQAVTFTTNTVLVNNSILMGCFFLFLFLILKEHKNPNSPIAWADIITDKTTNKLSLTKLGQLWGIVISSWVVITMAQIPAAYTIFPLIFPAYLAFLGGTWAWKSYMKDKMSGVQGNDSKIDQSQ